MAHGDATVPHLRRGKVEDALIAVVNLCPDDCGEVLCEVPRKRAPDARRDVLLILILPFPGPQT